MTQTVGDLLGQLRGVIPFDKAAGWDPVGLQIGDPAAQVQRVAVCHELTDEIVTRLEGDPVDAVVVYHPLLFDATRTLVAGAIPSGRAFRLIRARVAVLTVHTAFDVARGGAADALAAAIGLADVSGFGPLWPREAVQITVLAPADAVDHVESAMRRAGAGVPGIQSSCSYRSEGVVSFVHHPGAKPAPGAGRASEKEPAMRLEMPAPAGISDAVVAAMVAAHPHERPTYEVREIRRSAGFVGRQGVLSAPVSLGDLADVVSQVTGGSPRVAGPAGAALSRVAVIPGSGSSLISGVPDGVDVLVTGDVGHHRAREALDRGLSIVDPGHAETERPGLAALYAAVCAVRPDAVDLTDVDSSPWRTS